jgi:hypothetical protein
LKPVVASTGTNLHSRTYLHCLDVSELQTLKRKFAILEKDKEELLKLQNERAEDKEELSKLRKEVKVEYSKLADRFALVTTIRPSSPHLANLQERPYKKLRSQPLPPHMTQTMQ